MRIMYTHAGKAHRDDFLCACYCLASGFDEIRRVEQLPGTLEPGAIACDIGGELSHNIIDHHHLDKVQATCSFEELLKRKATIDPYDIYPWLESTSVLDHQGPTVLAEMYGIEFKKLRTLLSPIEAAILELFSQTTVVNRYDNLGVIMTEIGGQIIHEGVMLSTRMKWLDDNATVVPGEGNVPGQKDPFCIIAVAEQGECDKPELALDLWREKNAPEAACCITKDDRGAGLALYRFDDDPRIDFSRLEGLTGVSFAHTNGFIAKTKNTDMLRAMELVCAAIVEVT